MSGLDWFVQALKKYAQFEGRSRRKEYWYFVLFNLLFGIATSLMDVLLFGAFYGEAAVGIFNPLYSLAMLIPGLAVAVRRLHDTGRTGWWLLLVLIPLIGAIILIIYLVEDGQSGENEYGPNPKEMREDITSHLVD